MLAELSGPVCRDRMSSCVHQRNGLCSYSLLRFSSFRFSWCVFFFSFSAAQFYRWYQISGLGSLAELLLACWWCFCFLRDRAHFILFFFFVVVLFASAHLWFLGSYQSFIRNVSFAFALSGAAFLPSSCPSPPGGELTRTPPTPLRVSRAPTLARPGLLCPVLRPRTVSLRCQPFPLSKPT